MKEAAATAITTSGAYNRIEANDDGTGKGEQFDLEFNEGVYNRERESKFKHATEYRKKCRKFSHNKRE